VRALLVGILGVVVGCGPSAPSGDGAGDAGDCPGCVCTPGEAACDGDTSRVCAADGAGWDEEACDAAEGLTCGPDGRCVGACSIEALGESTYGCEFRPTITGNPVGGAFDFAIAVANQGAVATTVTIDGGGLAAAIVVEVPGDAVAVQPLPWRADLKLCDNLDTASAYLGAPTMSAKVAGGAYRVRSTRPVTVYQFNPLQYTDGEHNASTNDASLLYPVNAWGEDHWIVSYQSTSASPSLLAITAAEDDTEVTITTTATTTAAGGAPAFVAGVPQTIALDAGDVLELGAPEDDLTGTRVASDRPIQVIGGSFCTNVPTHLGACDHLEEVMPPVDALGADYAINQPRFPTFPDGKPSTIRIVATAPDTRLTFDPPQDGAATTLAEAGDWIEWSTAESYRVSADAKILVGQLMEAGQAGTLGDPSLSVAVPVGQYRTEYVFHAPITYEANVVDVTAPVDATIELDGFALTDCAPIRETGLALCRAPLDAGPADDGNHRIAGDAPFGISVYGFGIDTSYWYPGGMDLEPLQVE
jgi:hypothetical protein